MSVRFSSFLLASVAIHAVIVIVLFVPHSGEEETSSWQGGGDGHNPTVFIEMQPAATTNQPAPKGLTKKAAPKKVATSRKKITSGGTGAQGSGIDAKGASSPSTGALIRSKINRHKYLPLLAQEKGLTGSVKVRFQITPSGKLSFLEVMSSSGHKILDQAALKTVKRAVPLPYVKNPVALVLEYH